MANKKNTKKKANVQEKITDEVIVEQVAEPVVEIEDTVATTEVEVEPTVEKTELKVATYEVILAKPSYYVINKNGTNLTINKKNNYKKGDIVTL